MGAAYSRPMSEAHLVLTVLEPGPVADRILDAVADELHWEKPLKPDENGEIHRHVVNDAPAVWQAIHETIWADPENDGEMVVRLVTPKLG